MHAELGVGGKIINAYTNVSELSLKVHFREITISN